ncbi:hypothetical protein [Paenibacillus lignilyticus]|uniref:DUF3566 domain-containing protein n=1 Tax=Paenibacillus lignilyticus TaxID=1172615 RepID=A0ABS5CGW3_9BACL|nr:hypothetical protein [Paenibacillus lignilyticus]MBP3965099.1 hypothetical protein [Paenibacillus lignilyticus]
MRKVEIREIGTKSMFKTTIYLMIIPMALMAFIGLMITIIGAATGKGTLLVVGIPYLVIPFFLVFFYGALSMLVALVYSAFAKKFGGLELTLVDKDAPTDV